ncbi:hypothetical protein D9M70_592590 [compost metagenome]
MRPSAPPRNSTPFGTTTATRPSCGNARSIMLVMNAQSPLDLGGTPRQKRLYGSRSALSNPHLSRLNGGLATTTLNFISRSASTSAGVLRVSHHSMRAASLLWTNMFIRARAQVEPFTSSPNSA